MQQNQDNSKELILIGGGGHCHSVIDVIELQDRFHIAGIIDIPERIGDRILGYPVIGCDDDIPSLAGRYSKFLVTMGHLNDPSRRIQLFHILKSLDLTLPNIVSPLAYVSGRSVMGEGSVVMHRAVVNANACIGANCIINTMALIEHDAIIENHCHVSTSSIINGGVRVGEGSFIGSGTVCVQNTEVPRNSFIKANTLLK